MLSTITTCEFTSYRWRGVTRLRCCERGLRLVVIGRGPIEAEQFTNPFRICVLVPLVPKKVIGGIFGIAIRSAC